MKAIRLLYIAILGMIVLDCQTSYGTEYVQVREDQDIDDLLYCLVNLDTPTGGLWSTARHNGRCQTIAQHLFANHNGIAGHTAIRRRITPTSVSAFSTQAEIAQIVSEFVHIVNSEILRLANFNGVNIYTPTRVTLQTLVCETKNNSIVRTKLKSFFAKNILISHANGLRCFSIIIPSQYPTPENIVLEDVGVIPDRPRIKGERPCRIIHIWLPRGRGNTTPATVLLD